ncbi:hypothetical protein ccbrp13_56120 [Ktedonobacteria bacterium brp13]|nr:hypothetical protein ccbrp13_56120 [Ktedonobacteria bacterium brp13]
MVLIRFSSFLLDWTREDRKCSIDKFMIIVNSLTKLMNMHYVVDKLIKVQYSYNKFNKSMIFYSKKEGPIQ